jgi:lipopolysaccharide biosynthesis glycosyltransferase
VYVAYGGPAVRELGLALGALHKVCDYPVAVVSDERIPYAGVQRIKFERRDKGARWSKLNLDALSPFEQTLYLDVDTRVQGDIFAGFEILQDGYDFVVAPSRFQHGAVLQHINKKERELTFNALGASELLQLQAGVFFFNKSAATLELFTNWRAEWERFKDQDQAALLRALDKSPVKVWILSYLFNGGELVEHLFGRAVR